MYREMRVYKGYKADKPIIIVRVCDDPSNARAKTLRHSYYYRKLVVHNYPYKHVDLVSFLDGNYRRIC